MKVLEGLISDFKYGILRHARRPWYFGVAVLILMLGTGVNGVVFSLINGVLLRPIAARSPEQLVRLYAQSESSRQGRFSYPDYLDLSRSEKLSGALVTQVAGVSVRDHGQTLGEIVSPDYFTVLGVNAQAGRLFSANDSGRIAIISARAWERWYGRDPHVLGRDIQLNGDLFTVVGVTPPGFRGTFAGVSADVWVPLLEVNWLGSMVRQDRETAQMHMIARLAEGVNRDQAAAELGTLYKNLEKVFPRKNSRTGIGVEPATMLHGRLRKGVSMFLALMLGIAALVLFAACANLANVALMNAASRRRELAIRTALGASRSALMRQFLMEGLITAVAGGALGLLLAHWTAAAILRFNPIPSIPLSFDFSADANVLFFQFCISIVAGIALGFVPAFSMTRSSVAPALKEEGSGATLQPGKMRFRQALVFTQIAVSLVLLIASGLFLRSLKNAAEMDPGFDPGNALAMDIDLKSRALTEPEGKMFYEKLLANVRTLPGVSQATLSDLAPLDISTSRVPVIDPATGAELRISTNTVGPSYFQTLQIHMLRGRDFQEYDSAEREKVAIINETMARRFFGNNDPIGKTVRLSEKTSPVTVIGIARDVKYRTLGEEREPHIYLPFAQDYSPSMTLMVRTSTDPAAMLNTVQQEISRTDSSVQAFFARTLEQHTGFSLLPARLAATLSAVLGLITLAITCCGIYGSAGYAMSLRTREIGIRMALGAQPRDLLFFELRRGLMLAACALLAGAAVSALLLRAAGGLLYGISPTDPLTYALVSFILAAVTFVSIYFPSRRAVRIDPVAALRTE